MTTRDPDQDVLIIGGGISGLTVAWGLARAGVRVEVWEAAERPGGKIRTRREQGYTTEQSASLLLNFRPEVDRFIRDTGLEAHKLARDEARNGHRYLVQDGRLQAVPMEIRDLVFSPLWSWLGKLRMLSEILVPPRIRDGESVAGFIRRRLGSELLDKAIDPFVAGTLASDPETAEARATLPRLTALERRYGSITLGVFINRVLRKETAHVSETFSFDSGMDRLVQQLAATPGLRVRTGQRALEIVPERKAWRVLGQGPFGESRVRTRQLVLSTPAPAAARLLSPLDPDLRGLLSSIVYAPLAVVHLGLRRDFIRHPLDGTGFLVPKREGLSFNGNLWPGSLFPGRAPEGHTLLSSYVGGARHPQLVDWDQQRLQQTLLDELEDLLGLRGAPDFLHIDRHPQALPQYQGHYSAKLRTLQQGLQRWPGLHLAANYRGGVSIRDRIVEGLKTARKIQSALADGKQTNRLQTMTDLASAVGASH